MKKVISLALVALLLVAFAVPAFSAGINTYEQKLLDYVATAYVVDGKTITVTDDIMAQVKNAFNSDECDVTEAQYKEIVAILDKGLAYAKANNLTKIADLQKNDKATDTLLEYGRQAAAVLGATVATKGSIKDADHGLLTIYSASGKKVAEFHPNLKSLIAKTGLSATTTSVCVLAAVSVLAVAGVSVKKFRKVDED
jgi:hypothetical protein